MRAPHCPRCQGTLTTISNIAREIETKKVRYTLTWADESNAFLLDEGHETLDSNEEVAWSVSRCPHCDEELELNDEDSDDVMTIHEEDYADYFAPEDLMEEAL